MNVPVVIAFLVVAFVVPIGSILCLLPIAAERHRRATNQPNGSDS